MRFNPKARLDNSRTTEHGSGGGGGGMGGSPVASGAAMALLPLLLKKLGVPGVVIVVIVLAAGTFFGGGGGTGVTTPTGGAGTDVSRMSGDTSRYDSCDTGQDANESVDCARVAVENSLFHYWEEYLPMQNIGFRPAGLNTFTGRVSTACGAADSNIGPFYCPGDEQIYLDTTFFKTVLEDQLGGSGGDFVEPYVLAHEYGHHIQKLTGQINRVRTQKGPNSDAVRLELQADCYAGMWTRAAAGQSNDQNVAIIESIDRGDVEEALDAAKTVGDDLIQQKSGGQVHPEGWTHGSSQQRMNWFITGYEQGSMQACDTFRASRL